MNRFWKNCKGAVTVFVTLLLIPAVLISGTAVDLARIYTVRSTVQDANQLAANSILASYNAMIQDIYGLFGVMEDDPVFNDLMSEYIEVAILGENWKDRSMGTFQLFYGSNDVETTVTFASNKNLKNPDVLRRQIEEYAKYRAPVIIAERIVDILDSFDKIKEDAEIIKDKMDIDDDIEDIEKQYKKVYDKINEINDGYQAIENSAFESINEYLRQIREQIVALQNTRDDWTTANNNGETDKANDLESKYTDIMTNIKSLINGGTVKTGWLNGNTNDDGEWDSGGWTGSRRSDGIKKAIGDRKKALEDYKKKFDELVQLCEAADKKKKELAEKVSRLETKLNSGNCSSELKDGLTTPPKGSDGNTLKDSNGNNVQSTIDRYKALLKYDLKPMGEAMKSTDAAYIDSVISALNGVQFGKVSNNSLGDPNISLDKLTQLPTDSRFSISFYADTSGMEHAPGDYLYHLAQVTNYTYSAPNGFKRFENSAFSSTKNPEFYNLLKNMFSNTDKNNSLKKNAMKVITTLTKKVQDIFKGYTFDPEGALHYKSSDSSTTSSFVSEDDWGKEGKGKEKTKNALNSDIISNLGDMAGAAADKILLLVYDTEMFSCYTTTSDPEMKTMSGIPLGIDVNYYFQSEQEYLYNGNISNAKANLSSVAGLLFLVRFVFDYVASFTIGEVNDIVNAIEGALSFTGPFAIVIGEAARVVIAMAEATLDVGDLRSGHRVALFKNNDNWKFSVSGLLDAIKDTAHDVAADMLSDNSSSGGTSHDHKAEDEQGLFYSDYMRLFLLMVDGDTLADRTANLISLNVTNKNEGVGSAGDRTARENMMSGLTLVDLRKAKTDFKITTTVDMSMLFLSMQFAQDGVKGVIPPKTIEVTVTDYRGY
ncbi:hypothetical protein FACS1894208_02570 [Clostridia bacterium]|nr:hypothetical protein FACS1894208_02570 [Clostridia bacterium]